jgi:hypothetical protein
MRLTNSGEKRLRTAASAMLSSRVAISAPVRRSPAWKPMSGRTSLSISRAPRLLVRKMSVFSKLTTVLSPSRSVPRSRTPSSSAVSAGAAFSISSKRTTARSHCGLITLRSRCWVSSGFVSR